MCGVVLCVGVHVRVGGGVGLMMMKGMVCICTSGAKTIIINLACLLLTNFFFY